MFNSAQVTFMCSVHTPLIVCSAHVHSAIGSFVHTCVSSLLSNCVLVLKHCICCICSNDTSMLCPVHTRVVQLSCCAWTHSCSTIEFLCLESQARTHSSGDTSAGLNYMLQHYASSIFIPTEWFVKPFDSSEVAYLYFQTPPLWICTNTHSSLVRTSWTQNSLRHHSF